MTLGQVLGLVAIIIGFVAAVIGKAILHMAPLDWFVAAIALALALGVEVAIPGHRV